MKIDDLNQDADERNKEIPIEISPELLSEDILKAVIEDFILREGTDYGSVDYSLDDKVRQVKKQIQKGDVKIVFDQSTETISLMNKSVFKTSLKF